MALRGNQEGHQQKGASIVWMDSIHANRSTLVGMCSCRPVFKSGFIHCGVYSVNLQCTNISKEMTATEWVAMDCTTGMDHTLVI